MFDGQVKQIVRIHLDLLLQGAPEISFKALIDQKLPIYLLDYLNVALNPQLGGVTQVGDARLDFRDPALVANLEDHLMGGLKFQAAELNRLMETAIITRLEFILNPGAVLAQLIFERHPEAPLTGSEVHQSLDALIKVVQHWNPKIARAAEVIAGYLRQQPGMPVTIQDLTRLLRSAIEKEFTQNPLPSVEANLLILKELMQPALEAGGGDSLDFTEAISTMLGNLGLGSLVPGIQVEREVQDRPLDLDGAPLALNRLRLYLARGLLRADTGAAGVEAEVESFTSFIGGVG
jgi:hypothetical protein